MALALCESTTRCLNEFYFLVPGIKTSHNARLLACFALQLLSPWKKRPTLRRLHLHPLLIPPQD